MKKVLVKRMVLAVTGALFLGGCGSGQKERLPQKDLEKIKESQVEKETLEEFDSEKESSENEGADAAANEITGSNIPTISITQDRKEWYTDDEEVLLLEAEASRVEVVGDGFDALKDSLTAQWNGLDDYDNEELEWAKGHYDSLKNEENFIYFSAYSVNKSVGVYRFDNLVISLCESTYEYAGGAHGIYGNSGRTFDVESGKELELEDILSDPEGFYSKAVDYIIDHLEEDYEEALFPGYEETVKTDTFDDTPVSWYLDDLGIVIDYDLYMIAPYAAGMPSVTLPYDEFAAYIKEDYVKPSSSLISRIRLNEDFSRLIGETRKIMLTSTYSDEYSDAEVTIVSGDACEMVGTFAYVDEDAHVIKREDGRSFLVFYCDYASDDYVTYIYEVTGGTVHECDKLNGAAWNNTCIGTDRIGLSMHLDVLGSYTGAMVYQLTDEGKLIQTEDIFAVNAFCELTVVRDLPVTMEGEKTTIPAGSKIKIIGTDDAGKAYFQLDNDTGVTGMIEYERDDEMWQILIDGVSENEYFEMIPYAG